MRALILEMAGEGPHPGNGRAHSWPLDSRKEQMQWCGVSLPGVRVGVAAGFPWLRCLGVLSACPTVRTPGLWMFFCCFRKSSCMCHVWVWDRTLNIFLHTGVESGFLSPVLQPLPSQGSTAIACQGLRGEKGLCGQSGSLLLNQDWLLYSHRLNSIH